MKAVISLAALNRQLENFQGHPLNIEGPQMETCRERNETTKEKRGTKGQNKLIW